MAFKVPNWYRIRTGKLASDDSCGNCGAFELPILISSRGLYLLKENPKHFVSRKPDHHEFYVIADDGKDSGWEHVSLHKTFNGNSYMPSWNDMRFVKDLFWDEEDCVIQYHPPKSEYINNHNHILHLWRPINIELPRPPKILVGI